MADLRTLWTYVSGSTTSTFYEIVQDDYQQRFDGEYQYTKDAILGAVLASDSYIDLGAFVAAPLTKRCEFTTSALRNTFRGLLGTTGTLSSSTGLSYSVVLVKVTRIEGAIYPRADATWEQR